MRRAFVSEDLEPTAQRLLSRLQSNPNDANAAMDLCTIFELGGDPELALEFQTTALSLKQIYRATPATRSVRAATQAVPAATQAEAKRAIRVLAIKGPGVIMDNMPIEFLIENSPIELQSFYIGEGIPVPVDIPDHDVAIVAVCESDTNQSLLSGLESIVASWPRPVLNRPDRIAQLSRERLGRVVRNIDGLQFAESVRVSRDDLLRWDDIEQLPVMPSANRASTANNEAPKWIIRPVNSHAGHDLDRFASLSELHQYLERTTSVEFLIAPFVAYASSDSVYRKYRIALIRGESYPVHMALSSRWMVHYLNADMLHNAEHRDEEARFMESYETGFGMRHRRALGQLSDALGLDYVVLDCAETREGDLLLFEADNGAVVHSMDPVELFPYKRPAMENIFRAFQQLLDSALDSEFGSGDYSRVA